jgi:hypothetical protein
MASNAAIGRPPGLASVWSISGGTAPINTAAATRAVPWRPMYRATSPPPVECPTWMAVVQVEGRDERREIVGIRAHLVAVPWLAGTAVAASIVGNAPEATRREEHHLVAHASAVRGQPWLKTMGCPVRQSLK